MEWDGLRGGGVLVMVVQWENIILFRDRSPTHSGHVPLTRFVFILIRYSHSIPAPNPDARDHTHPSPSRFPRRASLRRPSRSPRPQTTAHSLASPPGDGGSEPDTEGAGCRYTPPIMDPPVF